MSDVGSTEPPRSGGTGSAGAGAGKLEGIALGCGNFGGVGSAPAFFGQGIAEDEAFAIMDRAWENGIRWFDTGDAYGGGTSERWIGAWRAARRPAGLRLTTKVFHSTTGTPGDTGLAPDRIRRQLEGSLARLGVDRIDLYLAHEPDPETPIGETIATFEALRSERSEEHTSELQSQSNLVCRLLLEKKKKKKYKLLIKINIKYKIIIRIED